MTSVQDWPVGGDILDKRNKTRHLRVINLRNFENPETLKACGIHTTMMSAPPSLGGLNGPPSDSQYRLALSSIQSCRIFLSSVLIDSSSAATPCRILWTVLVILNTPGFGFGTYLHDSVSN